ncbi:MAG: hypothetical protein WCC60_21490, partial [Ilumatobacteraceae bacterium]
MQHHRARLRLVSLTIAGFALVAAACGSDSSSSPATDKPSDTTTAQSTTPETTAGDTVPDTTVPDTTASADLPDTITIGYQNVPNGDLVVKHDRLLETAFGDSVKVEWKLFDSGGSVNEAVVAGAVDIGLV